MMVAHADAILAETTMPRGSSAWGAARRASSAVGTALSVLVAVVGAFGIVIAIATHFAPDGQYTVFGHPTMVVVSGSMSPAIHTGDLIVDDAVSAAKAAQLQPGQIISFRSTTGSATIITHRIARVTQTAGGHVAYITRGDANNAPDATPVQTSQIVGVFNRAIPYGGHVLNALHQPLVLALLLASPVLWLLSGLLFELAREAAGEGEPR